MLLCAGSWSPSKYWICTKTLILSFTAYTKTIIFYLKLIGLFKKVVEGTLKRQARIGYPQGNFDRNSQNYSAKILCAIASLMCLEMCPRCCMVGYSIFMPYYNSYSDPYLRVCIHSLMLGRLYSITVSNSDGVNNILVILLSLMNWQSWGGS